MKFDLLQSFLFLALLCDGGTRTNTGRNLSVDAEKNILLLCCYQDPSRVLSDFSIGFATRAFKVTLYLSSGAHALNAELHEAFSCSRCYFHVVEEAIGLVKLGEKT